MEHGPDREAQLQREEALRLVREESSQATESQAHAPEVRHEEPRREEPRYVAPEAPREELVQREEPRMAPPPPPPPPAPRVDPKVDLADAGLVMVETDRSKAVVAAPVAEEAPQLGRPRRERPQPLAQQDEPLQQVETKR
jgi:hypothetical protein